MGLDRQDRSSKRRLRTYLERLEKLARARASRYPLSVALGHRLHVVFVGLAFALFIAFYGFRRIGVPPQ